ncbi:MAG: serine--tRNA ligase, partial [Bacilli bacterium]|nr:serine--tRNA ligase [Bacilli bacterium]
MIDIKLIRENKELVKENIKKKFQDHKLVIVDEIETLDIEFRKYKAEGDVLRALKNAKSAEIGNLMRDKKIDEANALKNEIAEYADKILLLDKQEEELSALIKEKMMIIPNIIDESVPIGKDDSENVEVKKYGEPVIPEYEIPYHADILEKINGLDKDSSARTSGYGFYYLMGNVARLHSAMLSYARDFMIEKGFTYCI